MPRHPVLVAHDGQSDLALRVATAVARAAATGVELLTPGEDVAASLAEQAVHHDATALVLGADIDADAARHLTVHAACPVVVCPADGRLVAEDLGTIGVAYDDTDGSRLALTAAADLALRSAARLHIISVAPLPQEREAVDLFAREAAVGLDRVDVVPDVRVGDVTAQLRAAAGELDLLVCGSHGRGPVRRALLGSVSTDLIDSPACPIMVVPHHVRRAGGTGLGLSTAGSS
jgi:nucleotide-binding universal stress UspA family protein